MEIDPLDIWQNVLECIQVAVQNLVILDINPDDIVALAITNRRDTTVLWHKITGRPLYNAIGEFYRFFSSFVRMLVIFHPIFPLQLGTIAEHRISLRGFCQKIEIKPIY